MLNEFSRMQLLYGEEAMERLSQCHVAIFGVGGVGSFATEALARCGIGSITIIDNDTVSLTNINRQLIALHSTIGKNKVDVMKERILDINPRCNVTAHASFYTAENADAFALSSFDYIIDAIDTVSSKLTLIENAKKAGVPIICSMGAGNKVDPTGFMITDIYKTSVCPLAKVLRKELKMRGIKSLKVVYSQELPRKPLDSDETIGPGRRQVPGSTAFVPPVAGFTLASEVIRDLSEDGKVAR